MFFAWNDGPCFIRYFGFVFKYICTTVYEYSHIFIYACLPLVINHLISFSVHGVHFYRLTDRLSFILLHICIYICASVLVVLTAPIMNPSMIPILLLFAFISNIHGRHLPLAASSVRRTLPPQYSKGQQHRGIYSPRRKRTFSYSIGKDLDYGDNDDNDDEQEEGPAKVTAPNQRRGQEEIKSWSYLTYDREKNKRPGSLSLTSKIVWTNVIAYGIQVAFPSFTRWGLKLSDKILRGEDLYRLVSPIFLHGGITHLATNAFSLNSVGPQVEEFFGPGRFLATYLVSGIVGNIVSAYQSPNPALGASGAVFGIIGSCAVFFLRNDGYFGERGDAMISSLTRTIGINLLFGAMSPMIDNWAHLGGLLGGASMAALFGPRLIVMELPNGGRTIVDKPILKLPRYLESIPERIGDGFTTLTRSKRAKSRKSASRGETPWRKESNRSSFNVPNRSIKPRGV